MAEERWAGKPQGSARKGSNPFGADADAYMCVQEHVHVSAEVERWIAATGARMQSEEMQKTGQADR